jgi:hypothetical protein
MASALSARFSQQQRCAAALLLLLLLLWVNPEQLNC